MPSLYAGCASRHSEADTILSQARKRLAACLDDAGDSVSQHTIRAMRADLDAFAAWCAGRGLSSLPARPGTVVAYVDAMAEVRAPTTVRRYLFSIATAHRWTGERSPLEDAGVQRALRRMRRSKGRRPRQVRGLTWKLRRRLIEAAGDRLIDVRNRALLAVAYDAMLRRSELVAVLEVVDVTMDAEGIGIALRAAGQRPIREGSGATLYLHRDTVALVRAWLAASGITAGRLFRSVRKARQPWELSLDAEPGPADIPGDGQARGPVEREVVRRISGSQPPGGRGPGHDCVGDRDPRDHAGGTLEERLAMVQRYGERLLAQRNAAAQLARLQKRRLNRRGDPASGAAGELTSCHNSWRAEDSR